MKNKINWESFNDSFISITYLIWVIAKQQWKLLIALFVSSLLLIPAPRLFFGMMEDYKLASGLIAAFAIMPSLLTLLVFMPIVYGQITSSTLRKRMKSTGFSEWILNISLMLIFTSLALVLFYFQVIISLLIWNGKAILHYEQYWTMWDARVSWLALVTIVPISMFGLSSFGVLLAKWKLNNVIKGIAMFLIVIALLVFSRTLLSPIDYYDSRDEGATQSLRSFKNKELIFMLINPFGTMVYSVQYGIMGDILTSASESRGMHEIGIGTIDSPFGIAGDIKFYSPWPTFICSTTWTCLFTAGILRWG